MTTPGLGLELEHKTAIVTGGGSGIDAAAFITGSNYAVDGGFVTLKM